MNGKILSQQTSVSFCFSYIENMFKDQLMKNGRRQSRKWLFGSETLSGLSRHGPLVPVSRTSRNFTGHFRVSQFPLYLKNGEDFKSSNYTVIFLFVIFKTCLKIGFPKRAVGSFRNGFSGPKSYRDFRERGPSSVSSVNPISVSSERIQELWTVIVLCWI